VTDPSRPGLVAPERLPITLEIGATVTAKLRVGEDIVANTPEGKSPHITLRLRLAKWLWASACAATCSSKPDKTIAVIWGLFTDQQGQGQLRIAPAGNARLLDIMGNTVATAAASPGTVPLTATPYYRVFPETSPQHAAAALGQGQVTWSPTG